MDLNYIGKLLDGRYEILSLIGVGGMSNVYKAIDKKTGATVAVKFLKQEFYTNEELVRRFKNESKAISLLNSPNIIKVIDINMSDEEKYIVVEYIDGITLKQYMENRKVLSRQETVIFTATILKAMAHAHENGIIHRDLKPQNIMILRDGTLKIMDFGIARLSTANQHTVTDKAIGSVHYISPEQVRGKESDARSDIYSIGIMMYEMLTGTLPFVSDTAVSVAMKQVSDIAKKPSEIVDTIPKGLEQIVMKAIEKRPADRYQTAEEMIADLDKFKANPDIDFHYDDLQDEKTQFVAVDKVNKTKSKKTKVRKGINGGLPVMAGVARAFLLVSLISCYMIFMLSGNPLLTRRRDVELPNFVGMNESEVKNAGYGFKYNFEYVTSRQPSGTVIFQTPKPPKSVKENGTVKLKISKGPTTSQLKDLTGYSRADAESYLSDLDVNVDIIIENNKSVSMGHVIRTDPAMGSIVESGSTVTLVVSTGDLDKIKTHVSVPSVIGFTNLTDAGKTLAASDVVIGSYTYREDGSRAGTIIEQNPAAGEYVSAGTRVNLVVSSGPPKPVCGICGGEHETSRHECSYCHEHGHDVDDCPKKKRDDEAASSAAQPTPAPTPEPTPTPESTPTPSTAPETTTPPASSEETASGETQN